MRILTFGWDFPPNTTGGLGVACQGLTQELINVGVEVVFVLPRQQNVDGPAKFVFADIEPAKVYGIESEIQPYQSSSSLIEMYDENGKRVAFSRTILEEVHRYAQAAAKIAEKETFDIIHAHDWTSYLAGLAAKQISGKPLVLHVHATSFDQAASENVDPNVFDIEYKAFHGADSIVTVSNFTKQLVSKKYGIEQDKLIVVHNGINLESAKELPPVLSELKEQGKKIVFYNGRITIQKGVDYFVRAARKVVDMEPDVIFVINGTGDMKRQVLHLVASLGLSKNFIFSGELWGDERDRIYNCADLLVMPSVSEPFGLVPLEAIQHGTPVLISKQSGVSEVLTHALKVDFWDIDEMANKIIAALRYPVMNNQLVKEGKIELLRLSWRKAADKVYSLYQKLLDWWKNER